MDKFEIICYHGTDSEIAKAIVASKFVCGYNDAHWLGNGIYFYEDEALAKWWTTNPSNKFGSHVTKPALVKCKISIDKKRVLDIRTLEGYNQYIEEFDKFFDIAYKYRLKNGALLSYQKFRCFFFDWLFEQNKYDLLIAPFSANKQPYLPKSGNENFFKKMHILFTEGQICLSEKHQEFIIKKDIINISERG